MGGWFDANGYATTCTEFLTAKGESWEIGYGSKIIANFGGVLFGSLILMDLFIFIKYLLIRSRC